MLTKHLGAVQNSIFSVANDDQDIGFGLAHKTNYDQPISGPLIRLLGRHVLEPGDSNLQFGNCLVVLRRSGDVYAGICMISPNGT